MSYQLIIGNKNYSSWSMRAWLALRTVGAAFKEVMIPIYSEGARDVVRDLGGETGLVPVLLHGEFAVWDTLAIIEYLADVHPGLWPVDPKRRARARSYAGEVHSGFADLREAMPFNTRARGRRAIITEAVARDVARAVTIWETSGEFGSPWLLGTFSAADIMLAPIATRFRTYGVHLTGRAADYNAALLAHPLVVEWLASGERELGTIPSSEIGLAAQPEEEPR